MSGTEQENPLPSTSDYTNDNETTSSPEHTNTDMQETAQSLEIIEPANCVIDKDNAINNTEKDTATLNAVYDNICTNYTSAHNFDTAESKGAKSSATESTSSYSQLNNSEQTSNSNAYESANEADIKNITPTEIEISSISNAHEINQSFVDEEVIDESSTCSSEDVTATASDHPYRISTVETLEIVEPVYL